MPSPSDPADAALLACLRERFGVVPRSVERLDVGDPTSRIVRVRADEGDLFVKLRPGRPNEPGLNVPRALADRGIDVAIAPLPTRDGSLSAGLDGGHLIAYPYVDGAAGGETGMTVGHWRALGSALRRIHDLAPPEELAATMLTEDFTPVDLPGVRAIDDRLHEGPRHPAVDALAALWLERRDDVDRVVRRIGELAAIAVTRSDERTICHADIHPWNVLVRDDGGIAIVDWDDAKLAPRERDLMMLGIFAEPAERRAFGQGYGPFDADPVLVAYYQHERVVQDLAACANVIVDERATVEERRKEFVGLRGMFHPGGTVEIAFASDETL